MEPLAAGTGDTASIRVGVRLYAGLRCYLPDLPLGGTASLPVSAGTTVGDVLDLLGIPREKAHSCFVNGLRREHGFTLSEGDEMAFFPPIAGGRPWAEEPKAAVEGVRPQPRLHICSTLGVG